MNNIFAVMHYDYEDPDWSTAGFLGLSEEECYKFIDENFQDYLEYEWDEEEDGPFNSREVGEDWLKTELRLEIVQIDSMSENLAKMVNLYIVDEDARKKNEGTI